MRHSVIDLRTVSETQLALWFSQMDAEKQGRVERLRRAEDRARSVCADHLARLLLTQVSGETSFRFNTGENGKPTVLNCPWQFNLSHSGYFAACAVSEAPVGIDIEQLRPIRPALMRRVCTEQELRYVGKDSGRFLQLWTAKEAYLKFTGEGIAYDLRSVEVADETGLFPKVFGRSLHMEQTEEYVLSIITEAGTA